MTTAELEAGLDEVRRSPADAGVVEMIVRRPRADEREILQVGELDPAAGLVGDSWSVRGSSRTSDGSPHPGMQLAIMNARVIALVAQERERWPLAGDQLFIDMDLSAASMPTGTRLALGTAVIEVTDQPHRGCKKFVERFGRDAQALTRTPEGKRLQLRGIYARVVQPGVVRVGDVARKLAGDMITG